MHVCKRNNKYDRNYRENTEKRNKGKQNMHALHILDSLDMKCAKAYIVLLD